MFIGASYLNGHSFCSPNAEASNPYASEFLPVIQLIASICVVRFSQNKEETKGYSQSCDCWIATHHSSVFRRFSAGFYRYAGFI
jgi:hypothetical protein